MNPRFARPLAALALAGSALVGGAAVTACNPRLPQVVQLQSQSPDHPTPGIMAVNGQATIEVSPDCSDLTITIGTDHLNPGSAVKALDAKKLALIASLQKIGVEAGQVKLSNLQLDPIYAPTPEGYAGLKVRTYRASITITATTRDFTKLGDMMDVAASAGATTISTAFRRSDLPEQKQKVRAMALAAAKAKAEQTAAVLGIKLGRITAVAENAGGYMWSSQYFPSNASMSQSASAPAGLEIGASLQPLTLDVSITFELGA